MPKIEQGQEKKKSWRLLGLAVFFAVLAGVGTLVHLKVLEHRLEQQFQPQQETRLQVVVAASDLAAGSPVNSTTMAVRSVPAEYVNSDVITAAMFDSINGAVLSKPLERGKMLSSDFFDLNIPADFSGTIQIGHRAVTIQVGEINSVAGLIRPGNFVDIAARMHGGSINTTGMADTGEVILPVLSDALVLATGQKSARPNTDEFQHLQQIQRAQSYDTLTLEVTPKDAALLSLAEAHGSLIASLRNPADTAGIGYNRIGLGELVGHADELMRQARTKHQGHGLSDVHVDKDGNLVARNGVKITDPNVRMNESGLLVTKDGVVLSGRDLVVGQDGKIRTADGKLVDTQGLVAGENGTLVDKNGTVVGTNGYQTAKGGFLVDADGQVYTNDGVKLSGVEVGADGQVRSKDGTILNADQLTVGADGKVYVNADPAKAVHLDANGNPVTADGKQVGLNDLVEVGDDGTVRAKDGTIIAGAYADSDGVIHNADGTRMSSADAMKNEAVAHSVLGSPLDGVSGESSPSFARTVNHREAGESVPSVDDDVEFIIGGGNDGVARTFIIHVQRLKAQAAE